tara:strand:- start:82 stop:420 length:339 start_codon:yes stop_codon:yes gene_type:complete
MVLTLAEGWKTQDVQTLLDREWTGFAIPGTIKWEIGPLTDWRKRLHLRCRFRSLKTPLILGICNCPECEAVTVEMANQADRKRKAEIHALWQEKMNAIRQSGRLVRYLTEPK